MEALASDTRTSIPSDRDRYRVLEKLGEGSSATVYRVHDLALDEVVVLKALATRLASDAEVVERLKSEIRIARRVRHPNVARVYDLEEWDGHICISMEYIEGQTLERRLADGPLEPEVAVGILATLCLALESAHELGVVHRDIKPANIILDRLGHPYLLDFGIALAPGLAEPGARTVIRGSPSYMAPERWRGEPGLAVSDLYSLGVVAYEMLVAHPPFHASSLRVLMAQHLHSVPPPLRVIAPAVAPVLEALIARLLAKAPEARPASATEVLRALRQMAPARRREPGAASRGSVLVIDDEPAVRGLLAGLLRARGVTTFEAADGVAGVGEADRCRPDIVILDIGLPGMDGVDTLRALKSLPALAGRPVVMLSGSVDPQHPVLSRELGAVAFLNKPVNPDVLDLVLDKYLG